MTKHRQKLIQEMLQGGTVITEALKDMQRRQLGSVPGLLYQVHHVASSKYISFIHKASGKYLLRSVHVKSIQPAIELANHFFSRFDFSIDAEEITQQAQAIQRGVQEFTAELEREHLIQTAAEEAAEELAKEKRKNASKKVSR